MATLNPITKGTIIQTDLLLLQNTVDFFLLQNGDFLEILNINSSRLTVKNK
jgi:hypothetical protein